MKLNYSLFGLFLSTLFVFGCGESARTIKYSAFEKLGIEKRDIFKKDLKETKENQEKATEQFKDALTRLRELHNVQGGDLERTYDRVKADYDKSEKRAEDVRSSIKSVETVAGDLFKEWEKEIDEIQNPEFKAESKKQRDETIAQYKKMMAALKKSEAAMDPVLSSFKDHVLFLKHNLNARAIASLQSQSDKIQGDINNLISEMNKSIAEADQFIKTLE